MMKGIDRYTFAEGGWFGGETDEVEGKLHRCGGGEGWRRLGWMDGCGWGIRTTVQPRHFELIVTWPLITHGAQGSSSCGNFFFCICVCACMRARERE